MTPRARLGWFIRHESRLAWRDFLYLMTAGNRWRARGLVIGVVIFAAILHLVAWALVGPYANAGRDPGKTTLLVVTGMALLSLSAMLAQAMETVTRGLYARADLDLILSSPASARTCFAVRIGAMPVSITIMILGFAAPFINVMAWRGGAYWLCAYAVIPAMAMLAVAVSVLLTMLLFQTIGPKRTRLASQILAAVIGAGLVIFLQVAAILSYGSMSRTAFLQSPFLLKAAPGPETMIWIPARAILGDPSALAVLVVIAVAALAAATLMFSRRFAIYALAVAGQSAVFARHRQRDGGFRSMAPAQLLRRKERVLLVRDPWLMSQSLMQLLYLLPPAVLLWRSFGTGTGATVVLVPVLVMSAGQLAGGLAWLAVSGEDAPDLIATAPIPPGLVLRAKIEAVLCMIAMVFGPFIAGLALVSGFAAVIGAIFIVLSAGTATTIQLWFRAQARRSYFRRRQTSSRIATFAEAMTSVGWAATSGFAAHGTWLAVVPGVLTLMILGGVRVMSPAKT